MTRICAGHEGHECAASLEHRHHAAVRCPNCAVARNRIRNRRSARVKSKAIPTPRKADFEEIKRRAEMLASGLDVGRVAQKCGVSTVSIRMTAKRHFPKADTREKSARLWLNKNAEKVIVTAHPRCRYYIASKRKECGVLIDSGNYCKDCGPKTHFRGELHLAEVMGSKVRTDGPESRML